MLKKRIVVCLDVRAGKVTKGIKFKGNVDIGDPVAMADAYCKEGVYELVFYDITASAERRPIDAEVLRRVAEVVYIPFCVGGGIGTLDDIRMALLAGAEKVSINTLAVENPEILSEGAKAFGNQAIVLGMDALKVPVSDKIPSGYEVYIRGGREAMGLDAMEWAKRAVDLGAGEIVLNSIDADGTQDGYEMTITPMMSKGVSVPVVASGGAGTPEHVREVLDEGCADAALVASMTHYGNYTIRQIKEYCTEHGVPMRMNW